MSTATFQTTGTSLRQAAESRQIQGALSTALGRQVTALWPQLDAKRLDETFDAWLAQMKALTTKFYGMSSLAASIFYSDVRQAALAEPTPTGLVKIQTAPSDDWMSSGFGYSAAHLLTDPAAAPGSALSTTVGTAARIAATGGRATILDTVRSDDSAVGWYRVTDGSPCDFCAMLAGRGVTYSEESVDFLSHNDCGCSGAPAFSSDQALPEINQRAASVYDEHARGQSNPLAAFRGAWAAQSAPVTEPGN